MSTRLYKINGEYNTFEYWHDHYGYTRTPTFSVQYKTTNPWGATFASGGYYDAEDLMDIFTFSFFVPGVVGWYSIDDLALVGYYPAAATELTVARDSEVSNAATLTQDNETYYLVQNDIEYGWMSQAEFEARGWSTDVGDPPSYIVFDTNTGTIVHSIIDEGLVYGEVGYALMDSSGNMITVYETGVRTESFYFTTNGRNETENTNISHADIPVYNEDGTAPAADTPYNGSVVLAFMDMTGNTKQADGESLYLDDGELRLDAPDTDEGEQWSALVEYIEPAPPFPEVHSMTGRLGNSSSSSGDSTTNFGILSGGREWFFKLESGSYSKAVVNEGTVLAVAKINNTSNEPQYYGFAARRVASDGTVRLMNNNYATYNNATSVDIYYCEDPSVGVVTVTNGNGDKFWAFKYIVDGASYYYVLDLSSGSLPSQSWVFDLSSLGYTLFNATLYYLSSPKEPIVISSNGYSNLLLDNGNYLSYNSSRKYRIINAYTSETDSIGIGCESFWVSSSMSLATLYNSDVAHAFYSVEIVIT